MRRNIKHLVFGICIAFVLLGALMGAASATARYAEGGGSNQVGDEVVMPFYNDIITPHRMPPDRLVDEDEGYLTHEKHISSYKRPIRKQKLEQIIGAAGTQKSNYTFSLHGNVNLLWSYVNDERDAVVDFEILDDVNGDGIVDVLASDRDSESKLFVISGKDGSTIWNKNYPAETWIDMDELEDVNGDGINDAIVYWDEYDRGSNQTNITIKLLSGSNGDKVWSKKISYEGRYLARGHATHGDLTGDGIEDILIEAESWELGVSILHALNSKDGSKLWERVFIGEVHGYNAWSDLTGDGINDFTVASYNREDNTGELSVIKGSDGSVEWHKSFVGDTGWPDSYEDFDGDGLNDVQIENNDADNETGRVLVFKGTDGSVIWSKSFNHRAWMFDLSDFNGDGIEEQCLELENFTTRRVEEVQVLNGRDGSLIWRINVNASEVEGSDDLNGDDKDDILLINRTAIAENEYLHDVNAISGVDGSEIWKNSFLHDIEIEIPEDAWTHSGSWPYGWKDLNGDGLTDILLDIDWNCNYWDENTSTSREYSADKLILINGKNGSEIWDAECTLDEYNWLSTRAWKDFNNDGIKDVLLGTRKGVYLLTTSGIGPIKHPKASFTYSPENPIADQNIIFDASSSYDPDGYITKYEWNFGDGNTTTTTNSTISHTYSLDGSYSVTLTVEDNDGLTNLTSKTITVYPIVAFFDTGSPSNPYPSISGTHNGTITPNQTIIATKLYTYPCLGTGGHSEYVKIWNDTWSTEASWNGYKGDWHNITFDKTVVLMANETYNFTIRTGSYPQIHHTSALQTANGWINCTGFKDVNGKRYKDRIPAIRLFS